MATLGRALIAVAAAACAAAALAASAPARSTVLPALTTRDVTTTFTRFKLPLERDVGYKPLSIAFFSYLGAEGGVGREALRVHVFKTEAAARTWAGNWQRRIGTGIGPDSQPIAVTRTRNVVLFVFASTSPADQVTAGKAMRALGRITHR